MARPAGHPKTGGRQRGTKNKRSNNFAQALKDSGVDPIARVVALAKQAKKENNAELELKVLRVILPYCFPRLSNIDATHYIHAADLEQFLVDYQKRTILSLQAALKENDLEPVACQDIMSTWAQFMRQLTPTYSNGANHTN